MAKYQPKYDADGDEIYPQTDEELNAIIAQGKKRAAIGYVIAVIGVVLLLAVALTLNPILILIAILIFGVGLWYISSAKSEIKRYMTNAALLPALQEVFDKVEYHREEHIPDGVIRGTDMGFDFTIDKVGGSDYIKAEYYGVGIEMSDIRLTEVTETTDADGDTTTTETNRFQGMWLICDFHKNFTADLLLRERKGTGDKLLKKGIKTENDAFNKQFYIESESEHDVFYILTPHMMEYIMAMDKKAGGRTYMRFLRRGKLVLALDTGRDAFEVGKLKGTDAAALRAQFISEVRYVTELIDELKLVKTLHKKD